MILRPSNRDDLARALRAATEQGARVEGVDLSAFKNLLQHTPEDMTVTAEAGLTLGELQAALAQRGQWLPIDPPAPEQLTLATLLATNASGPRRFGLGTIRDYLIGLQVALADGRLIRSGGKVVKNVAGYDLMKLFIGAQETLGFIVEATFKLLPRPEQERFAQVRCDSLEEAARRIDATFESELSPVLLDLHRRLTPGPPPAAYQLIIGFAGTSEEVAWQVEKAGGLGFAEPASLDDENAFWSGNSSAPEYVSVPPSRLAEAIAQLGEVSFLARAGNGVIYYRGGPFFPRPHLPVKLMRRAKDTFDPKHILPEPSL